MPISNQMAEKSYKKLQNLAITGANRFTFNEPFYSPLAIDPTQIWLDQSLISNVASGGTNGQISGVIQRYIDLVLTAVPGTTNSFFHSNLKDCIPHTYGDGVSYNIVLKDSTNAIISLGQNDWEIDREGGVLTFFGAIISGAPSGNNIPPANMPPKITFYKYVGAKGNDIVNLNEGTVGTANSYVFNSTLSGRYTSNVAYVLKVANTNTGASTININSFGAKSIKKNDDGNLVDVEADDIKSGVSYILIYDSVNGVFQIASGAGGSGNASLKIIDIDTSEWVLNSGVYTYTILNYSSLGFKEVGSVQLWEQVSGNVYDLVSVDFEINNFTKELIILSLSNPTSQLRIMGGGKIVNDSTSGILPYLNDISDVNINNSNLTVGDSLSYDGSNWVNTHVETSAVLIKEQLYSGSAGSSNYSYIKKATSLYLDDFKSSFVNIGAGSYTSKTSIFDGSVGGGWLGTTDGVVLLSSLTLTNYKYPITSGFGNSSSSNVINDLCMFYSQNSLIFSTNDGIVIVNKSGNTFSTINTTSVPSKKINQTLDFGNNDYLYSATNNGMLLYSTTSSTQTLYSYPTTPGFGTTGHTSNYLLSLLMDGYDNSILSMTGDDSSGNGGYLVKNTGGTFTTYCYPLTTGFGISNNSNYVNSIKNIIYDSGIVWIGTKDGLIKFDRSANTFTTYSYFITPSFGTSSLSNNINCLIIVGNIIYIGNKIGEIILFNTSTSTATTLSFPGISEINDGVVDAGYLAFACKEGVVKLNNDNTYEIYTIPYVSKSVFPSYTTYPNTTVVGTVNGLYNIDSKIKGVINLKNSLNTVSFTIDNSATSPDITNDSLTSLENYATAISDYINNNFASDYNAFLPTAREVVIVRTSPLEGASVISDESVKIWGNTDILNTSRTNYIDYGYNYANTKKEQLPISEPLNSNFGYSRNAHPSDSIVTKYNIENYYYNIESDVWMFPSTFAINPTSYTTDNLLMMNSDGTQLIDSGISASYISTLAIKPLPYNTNNLLVMGGTSGNQLIDTGLNVSLFSTKYNNAYFVDPIRGNDNTSEKGAILKPCQTIGKAVASSSSGDLVILMPGEHTANTLGIEMKDGVDFYLLNATIKVISYGGILNNSSDSNIKFKMFGKGAFKRAPGPGAGAQWAMITPYPSDINIDFDGIDFICGNFPFIGSAGETNNNATNGTGGYLFTKTFSIKNSYISTTDNSTTTANNSGNVLGNTRISLENCYVKGLIMLTTQNDKAYNYNFKAKNTTFESISTNTNGVKSSLIFLDYYDNPSVYKALFYNCNFISDYENIGIGGGYLSTGGTNKHLYFYDCKFINGSDGWIIDNSTGADYKLINNWSTNTNTGTSTITNLLVGSGITIDNNLEIL